jgi:O-succinylbenzoic acid--CoA ligase
VNNSIADWLAHRADVLPNYEALIDGDLSLTFAELNQRVLALVGTLEDAGVRPGDRVAILAQNSVELVEAIHAVPRAGAILVPLNTRLTTSELATQLRDAGVRLLLCERSTEAAAGAAATAPSAAVLPLPLDGRAPSRPVNTHQLDDVHSIIYTSGTTGRPKGAMLTFGNFWASATGSAFNLGVMADDRWLACMPLFHVGGLSIVLRSAIYGTTIVLQHGFDEREVVASLYRDGVTHISVVASMLQRSLDADDRRSPPSLRVVLVGGGPVPPDLLARALDRGFPVLQTYGLTEAASQVTTLAPGDALSHLGSAGKPLITTQLRVDAAPGDAGEILVGGPTVTPGYFGDAAATAAAIPDGWLHTGDIGRLDPDGFLFVLDRRDDLIVSGGENVYPAEVEAVLLGCPGVVEAAVVGVPDEKWGLAVAAALVVNAAFASDEVEQWTRSLLAGYKVPRIIRIVDELPKTASGKTQRRLVREMFAR